MSESSRTISWDDPAPTAELALQLSGRDLLTRMMTGAVPPPPIAQLFGFTLVEVGDGEAIFEITPDGSHYNAIGVVHGGLALTMVDSATGCAVHTTLPAGQAYTSLETKANFLRPITLDSGLLRAHGRVTKPGRRAAFAEAEIRDANGTLLATGSSTCAVFPVR